MLHPLCVALASVAEIREFGRMLQFVRETFYSMVMSLFLSMIATGRVFFETRTEITQPMRSPTSSPAVT
jgi:hypothetical protein